MYVWNWQFLSPVNCITSLSTYFSPMTECFWCNGVVYYVYEYAIRQTKLMNFELIFNIIFGAYVC